MATVYRSVQIPADLLEALGDTSQLFWSDPAIEPIIYEAIRAWLKNTPTDHGKHPSRARIGYQWKQLFLPSGTRLRASFKNKPYYANVSGNRIKCGQRILTPSAFANLHGCGTRNAWLAIWLRFPGDEQWLLASTCRSKQQAAINQLFRTSTTPSTTP